MKKQLKKLLCAALSLTMVAGSVVLPAAVLADDSITPLVEGDTVLKEWKFSFGTAEKDGYIAVSADRNVITSKDYGFIGNDENVMTNTEKYDSFTYASGQVVKLQDGANGVGVVEDEEATYPEYTTGAYYPVSFGLYVTNGSYYRVHAEVTTLDTTKDAEASLYYERRHPVMHKQKIEAGQTASVDFSVDVETINFKNEGDFVDDMLNIALLGDNAALSSLVIQQIDETGENKPTTLWVIGDSTVTDGSAALPYFDLQNYTGVGAYLSKYVPSTVAVSNQGEGGLNATDNSHFVIAKNNIKKGDFMYVEYGHNHKDDSNSPGPVGYLSCLSKYYEACKAVGATLILVGPIDRHNWSSDPDKSQYDSATNTWSTTLAQFSKAAKYYVDIIKTAGKAKADEFVAKAAADPNGTDVSDATYEWADEIIAAGVTDDADSNVAFVDLNQPTLDWLTTVTASGTVKDEQVTNDYRLANFYFQTSKGGTTDGTHPNDAGADALAQKFFTTADLTAYPALAPLMTRVTDGDTDVQPVPVSAEIINAGYPSNDFWPTYQSLAPYEFATRITSVNFDSEGVLESVDVLPLDKSMMSGYSRAYFALYDKETGALENLAVSTGHVDNTQDGLQNLAFDTDLTVGENQIYKVFLWGYLDDPDNGNPTTMVPYAYPYTPVTVIEPIITNASDELNEEFKYDEVAVGDSLDGKGGWAAGNDHQTASEFEFTYNEENNGAVSYAHISSNGLKSNGTDQGSAYVYKKFDEPVSTGKIMMDFDFRYKSGTPSILFVTEGDPWTWPAALVPFKVALNSDNAAEVTMNDCVVGNISAKRWSNIHYELDLDRGIETMSIDGGTPVSHTIENYQTTETTVSPASLDQIVFEYVNKAAAFDFDITNLKIAKIESEPLPKYTVTVASNDAVMGTVAIADSEETTGEFELNTITTLTATPNEGYRFAGWYSGSTLVSEDAEHTFRLRDNVSLTANFEEKPSFDSITTYKLKATETMVKVPVEEAKEITLTVEDAVNEAGISVPVDSANSDEAVWSLVEPVDNVTLEGNVLTVSPEFTLPETSEKNVEVKCECNGIEKTITIMLHTYNYLLNMSFNDGTVTATAYDSETAWEEANGNTMSTAILGRGGHYITRVVDDTTPLVSPFGGYASYHRLTGNGVRSGASNFDTMQADALVIEFDLGIGEKSFIKLGNNCNKTQDDVSATFLVLEPSGGKLMYYDYTASAFMDTGLAASTDNQTYSSLYHVKAAVDFKAKTETVTITPYKDGEQDIENTTTITMDITNATADSFSQMGVSHEASGGTVHVLTDNITVRTDASSAE